LQSRLSGAEARLAFIRQSPNADSVSLAAEASRLIPQIAAMRAEVEKQSQPVERTVSALDQMREQLKANTEDALAFADALSSLSASGLNADAFAQIAASGNVGLATELAAGGASAVSEINDLWNQRAEAAAQVAAFATQEVYGQQQAILQAQIDNQNKLIQATSANIKALHGEVKTLGNRVEHGAERGVKSLGHQISQLEHAIQQQGHQIANIVRSGKGRH
jgi:chromosome segregation ATPase